MLTAILDFFRGTTKDDTDTFNLRASTGLSGERPNDPENLKLWNAINEVKVDLGNLRAEMCRENHNNTKWILQVGIGSFLAIAGLVSAFGIAILNHVK